MAWKEMLSIRRNSLWIRTAILVQVLEILCVGWIDNSGRHIPLAVVDQDRTAESRELIARLEATQAFAVKYLTTSTEQARSHIRAGRVRGAIVIPPDYGRNRARNTDAQLLAIVDGSDGVTSRQAVAAAEGLAVHLGAQDREGAPRVEAHASLLFNPNGSVSLFMLPGLLGLLLSNNFTGRALAIAHMREQGSLERLLMTPLSHVGLMLGLILPYVAIVVLDAVVYIGVMHFGFDVPLRGSLAWLFVALVLYSVSIMALGSLVASDAKSIGEALTNLILTTMPSTMLSGYIFPLASLPKWLLPISYALPLTHFVEIMRGLCLRGASVIDLAPNFAYLSLCPVLLLVLAARRFSASVLST